MQSATCNSNRPISIWKHLLCTSLFLNGLPPHTSPNNSNIITYSPSFPHLSSENAGLNAELFYVRNGSVNKYAMLFVIPVNASIYDLEFSWQSLTSHPVSAYRRANYTTTRNTATHTHTQHKQTMQDVLFTLTVFFWDVPPAATNGLGVDKPSVYSAIPSV